MLWNMRHLGIDYGTKKIGLSVSDERGSAAFPLEVLDNDSSVLGKISEILKANDISRIVMGDGRSGGRENSVTAEIEKFATILGKKFSVPVELQREDFSSTEAARFVKLKSGKRDDSAAAIILQRFLDAEGS